MNKVNSKDGTTIAFDRLGEAGPVILVSGASTDRMVNAPLADHLAPHFSVFNYDRRGRGDSGDTSPYAVEREVEDLDAVIAEAGGAASVYGTSSGAALALEAAASGLAITKLALWEPPFIPEGFPRPPEDQVEQYERMVAEDRRGDAVEFFMSKVVGLPPEFVAKARNAPFWAGQEAIAHTLAYDARIMGDYSLPAERAASVPAPTLVIAGTGIPWMGQSADALAAAIPDERAHVLILDGQGHDADPALIAEAVRAFLSRDGHADEGGNRDG